MRCLVLSNLVAIAPPATAAQQGLSAQEQHGREVYERGTSPSGVPLFARLGRRAVRLPASAIPCASCHGADGRGRPEGGVAPSNITWSNLSKAYGQRHQNGRTHPPYDARSLQAAFLYGRDPAGNELDLAMPRYDLPAEDAAALTAYIQRLELLLPPGVTEGTISIGLAVSDDPAFSELRHSVWATLDAYFRSVNDQGGVYRRSLKLVDAARGEPVFALIGDVDVLIPSTVNARAPMLVPFAFTAAAATQGDRPAYFLLPPLVDQMRAILDHAVSSDDRGGAPSVAVLIDDGVVAGSLRRGAEEHLVRRQAAAPIIPIGERTDWRRVVKRIEAAAVSRVVLIGGAEMLRGFAGAAMSLPSAPQVLVLGALVGAEVFELPDAFPATTWVAYPTAPSAAHAGGLAAFRHLLHAAGVGETHPAAQTSTLAAGKLLVDALRRTGRDVTQESLVTALQSVTDFETGLVGRLSFGPNRRIGVAEIPLLLLDRRTRSFDGEPNWIRLVQSDVP